ncbi:MAG: sigma-70 family RNA polymerase sigma factor [Pseudomonadota bacterium]
MDKHLGDDDSIAQFEALALPHLDAAYNLARWLTRDDHDAHDLVQAAYLRAFRHRTGFRGGDAKAWLMTIVRNTYYTQLRDRRHARDEDEFDEAVHGSDDDSVYAIGVDPARIVAGKDAGKLINRALDALPRAFREVLVLKELDELSYQQIAEVAGIPIGTVMSRLARARKLLLACLVKERAGE